MKPPFSRRTAWDREPSAFAAVRGGLGADGGAIDDLTASNPTVLGFGDLAPLVAELGHPRGLRYEPEPLGHEDARAAVAAYLRARGATLGPERVCLAASTSEAYGWLFRLLADPDDTVLVPCPSYPLFGYLADLADVRLEPYPLAPDAGGFAIDLDALVAAVDDRTRAIVIVNPNNPTGSFLRREEVDALDALAARHGIALIVDEVFADYPIGPVAADRVATVVARRWSALTFALGGLSKAALLPQVKLGWVATLGDDAVVAEALARLEIVADAYLSVGTPVQRALPAILAATGPLQARVRARVAANLAALDAALAGVGARSARFPVEAGWYATLRLPSAAAEDPWVERLAREARVLVHPGHFFGFAAPCVVVSLLPETDRFAAAAVRLARFIGADR